jgi:hypothetical protein
MQVARGLELSSKWKTDMPYQKQVVPSLKPSLTIGTPRLMTKLYIVTALPLRKSTARRSTTKAYKLQS